MTTMSKHVSNISKSSVPDAKTWSWESKPRELSTNRNANRSSDLPDLDVFVRSQSTNEFKPHDASVIYPSSRDSQEEPHAVSQDGPPSTAIPEPYLPLRKRDSQTRRSRTLQSFQENDHEKDNITLSGPKAISDMVQGLRPDSTRWSRDSKIDHNLLFSDSDSITSPESRILIRPSTASTIGLEDNNGVPPLVQSPISISDTSITQSDHNSILTTNTSPHNLSPNKGHSSTFSNQSHISWRDRNAQTTRESVITSTTEATTVMSDARSSDIWTTRSSRTKYDSQSDEWQRESDDDFSVEDCIAMYADMPDNPRDYRSSRREEIPPVPPIVIPTSVPKSETAISISPPPIPAQSATSEQSPMAESTNKPQQLAVNGAETTSPKIVPFPPLSQSATPITPVTPVTPESSTARPSQRRVKPARDTYGFKNESHHVTQDQYNAWYKDYKVYLARRKKKWTYLMNTHGLPSDRFPEVFPPRSGEVKRFIRKGVPPEWRGAAWFYYGDGAAFLDSNLGLYDRLVKQAAEGAVSEQYVDIIERDLHRTFPDNIYFKPDTVIADSDPSTAHTRETEMIKALRRVLQAYAIHHPKVGYCQSLNFLAGFLLLFMRLSFRQLNYEERAFALLCILTEKYLPGTHSVVLEGCDVDIGVLMTILQETMPSIWTKLNETNQRASSSSGPRKLSTRSSVTLRSTQDALPDVSLATTAWFMSCFVSTLPIESACRVWDCLWYEGSKTIFRVALAIFKLGEKAIRKANDGSEVFQIVQTLPKGLLDANELMSIATMKTGKGVMERLGAGTPGFGGLSQSTVETRREERRAFSKESMLRSRGLSSPEVVPKSPGSGYSLDTSGGGAASTNGGGLLTGGNGGSNRDRKTATSPLSPLSPRFPRMLGMPGASKPAASGGAGKVAGEEESRRRPPPPPLPVEGAANGHASLNQSTNGEVSPGTPGLKRSRTIGTLRRLKSMKKLTGTTSTAATSSSPTTTATAAQ